MNVDGACKIRHFGVIQPVVNRTGYTSENALAIYYYTRGYFGKQRWFGSYSSAPAQLQVTYEYYTISGTVTTTAGTPLQDVQITAGPNIEPATTNAAGFYQLNVPTNWSGSTTVAKDDWGFTQWSKTYSNTIRRYLTNA